MNILVISMEPPIPTNSGARMYLYQRLKLLRKSNNVVLFSLVEGEKCDFDESDYNEICNEFYFFNRGNKFKNYVKNINLPYSIGSRSIKLLKESINNYISKNGVDIIYLTSIHMFDNLPLERIRRDRIKVILAQDNIEYLLFRDIASKESNLLKKIVYYVESLRLEKFEMKVYKSGIFSGFTFISENDLTFFQNKIGNNMKCVLIPPYVEEKFYKRNITNNKIIVFTGKMNYQPNIQAVKWFCNEVLPLIKEEVFDVKFYIVGKNPTEEVLKLANEYVIVTGQVNDVGEYLRNANIVVVPLLSGGGVKLKIFEAIQNYNIIVTTSKGIEGTKLKPGEHVLVSDCEKEFATLCINVLKDTEKYEYLAKNAQLFLKKYYSEIKVESELNSFLKNI